MSSRDLEEWNVNFEETSYEAFVNQDEVGVGEAGVEEVFASGYTKVDTTRT